MYLSSQSFPCPLSLGYSPHVVGPRFPQPSFHINIQKVSFTSLTKSSSSFGFPSSASACLGSGSVFLQGTPPLLPQSVYLHCGLGFNQELPSQPCWPSPMSAQLNFLHIGMDCSCASASSPGLFRAVFCGILPTKCLQEIKSALLNFRVAVLYLPHFPQNLQLCCLVVTAAKAATSVNAASQPVLRCEQHVWHSQTQLVEPFCQEIVPGVLQIAWITCAFTMLPSQSPPQEREPAVIRLSCEWFFFQSTAK